MNSTSAGAGKAPSQDHMAAVSQLMNLALQAGADEVACVRVFRSCVELLVGLGLPVSDVSLQLPDADPDIFLHYGADSSGQGTARRLMDEPSIRSAWQASQPLVSPVAPGSDATDGRSRTIVPLASGGCATFVAESLSDEQVCLLQPFADVLRLMVEPCRVAGQLADVEDQLSLVLESAQVGIWEWDMTTGAILRADNIDAFLGTGTVLVPTRAGFLQHVHPEDHAVFNQALDRSLSMGADYAVEFRLLQTDGSSRWTGAQGLVFFDRKGVAQRMVGVLVDVHERRMLETQVQRSQKLQAVGTLAGGVAHEVNNQLTIIGGVIEILLLGAVDAKSAEAQLRLARDATDRTALITRQLLTFSRREVSQPVAIDLSLVVAETQDMLRHLLGDNVQLHTSTSEHPVWALCDRSQVEQVIINLALNARDAMPEGGTIALALARADLDHATAERLSLPQGQYARLSVEDTGCGMDEDTRTRMFEPFFTTKGLDRGTGLGLSTTLGIIREAAGMIDVDTQPGSGTTVTIYLPLLAPDIIPAAEPEAPTAQLARGAGTVLLVEDEAVIRLLLSQTLRQSGYTVLEAGDAEQALRLLQESAHVTVDLLITDVVLPGMNGRQLADELASHGLRLRVLYVSGYTDQSLGRDGVLPPDTHFLHKPFTPQSLALKVQSILAD